MIKFAILEKLVIVATLAGFVVAVLSGRATSSVQQFDRFERISQALESYAIDNAGKYPASDQGFLPRILTTPVAYISRTDMVDPLALPSDPTAFRPNIFRYVNIITASPTLRQELMPTHGAWLLYSPGFDRRYDFNSTFGPLVYDPTNGLISSGDVVRSQLMSQETGIPEP